MPQVWFTSDMHFGHQLLADIRGFDSVAQMDETLVEQWNACVGETDHVYHLGDFAFGNADYVRAIARNLRGKMFFVRGNHDHTFPRQTKNYAVDMLADLTFRKINGQKVVLCHYPMLVWQDSKKSAWMLHGHCHGNLKTGEQVKRLDVGVDTQPMFRPIAFEEITSRMGSRGISNLDHHGNDHWRVAQEVVARGC